MRSRRIFLIALLVALAPLARGQTLEALHSFGGPDGMYPLAGLVQGKDGNFYGTTEAGGTNGYGTIFKMVNGTVTTLISLDNASSYPWAGLVQGSNGDFYGTTRALGNGSNYGTVFKITANGTFSILVSFNNTNGAHPEAELIEGEDGTFYGTTTGGGLTCCDGTVFKVTTNGILTTLAYFKETNGTWPSQLIIGSDGSFYGTSKRGGTNYYGAVFKMTTNGTLTALVSFNLNDIHGRSPQAGLTEGTDGNFYGTTQLAGASGLGTVFRMTPTGGISTLVSFNVTNGSNPVAELFLDSDGNFYGTTSRGGGSDNGTVFRMTTNGILTRLVSFNGNDGAGPRGGLVKGNDGNLYGTTYQGGTNNYGTVFRIVMPVSLNSRVSGNELVLSWPTNHVGFTLQAAADLNSPTNWIDFTNAPAVVGAQFTVTNNLSASAQFYRLKKP